MENGKQTLVRIRALREHLKRRRDALAALLLDLDHLPVDPPKEGPFPRRSDLFELVFCVDWSEIHAYVMRGGPPLDEPLRYFLETPHHLHGAHQAALTFLFERFPAKLIILPPYASEMMSFVEITRSYFDSSIAEDFLSRVYTVLAERNPDAINKLERLVASWKGKRVGGKRGKNVQRFAMEDLKPHFDQFDQKMIRTWLKRDFAPLFLHSRLATLDALKSLKALMAGAKNRPQKLIMLIDFDNKLTLRSTKHLGASEPWQLRLRQVAPEIDRPSCDIDGLGLAYLEALNILLNERGQQAIFVTRSARIQHVTQEELGRFASLKDYYRQGGASLPPTLVRSWLFYLELGSVWMEGGKTAMRKALEDRYERVLLLLEWFDHRPAAESWKPWMEDYALELVQQFQNLQAYFSAQVQELDENALQDPIDQVLTLFVKYVKDPVAFAEERRAFWNEIRKALVELGEVLPSSYSEELATHAVGPYKSITRAVIEKIGTDWFVSHLKADPITPVLKDVLQCIQKGNCSHGRAKLFERVTEATASSRERLVPVATQLRLIAVWCHAVGAWWRAKMIAERLLETERFGPTWILCQLIVADCELFTRRIGIAADEVLARTVERIKKGKGRSVPIVPVGLALLNARLMVNLDIVEEFGEDQSAFPRGRDGQSMLKDIASTLWAQAKKIPFDDKRVPDELRYSVMNNIVYASARLMDPSSYEESRFLEQEVSDFIRKFEERDDRGLLTLSECHTLGYYYFKLFLLEEANRQYLQSKAVRYLSRVACTETGLTYERTRQRAQKHLELLELASERLGEIAAA